MAKVRNRTVNGPIPHVGCWLVVRAVARDGTAQGSVAAPDGSAWVINVFCAEETNNDRRVGAVYFSKHSFVPHAQIDVWNRGQTA